MLNQAEETISAQSILNEYTVDSCDVIRNPGKFEGEHFIAPYLYEMLLDGGLDGTDDEGIETATLTDAECQAFKLPIGTVATVSEDDNGFFYVSLD